MRAPEPIAVREPYFATMCEHCGWRGSSEQCKSYGGPWGDSDVYCPACHWSFCCDEITPTIQAMLEPK